MMTTKNIRACLAFLGNPQHAYQSVHVGGTNGKGSTSYFLSQMLETSKKIGLYTSPFYMKRFDNIWVDGKQVDAIEAYYLQYKQTFQAFDLTPFEEETALAFIVFKLLDIDIAIVEVGLGGTHDATNVIEAEVSIITSCSIEHEEILGPTLYDIATHQAGIIKRSQHVILSPTLTIDVFEKRIKHMQAMNMSFIEYPYQIMPSYQHANASLAYTAYRYFEPKIEVIQSLKMLPFRFERNGHVIYDGAHNLEGIQLLTQSLKDMKLKPVVIMSTLKTKPTQKMINTLKVQASSMYVTTFDYSDAIDESFIRSLIDVNVIHINDIIEMINSPKHDIILVTGSLYFIRYIKGCIQ